MEEIGIEKYLKPEPLHKMERSGYNRVNMLKTVLFASKKILKSEILPSFMNILNYKM
jgi:hypothetical protein